jgi:hypothetical protein
MPPWRPCLLQATSWSITRATMRRQRYECNILCRVLPTNIFCSWAWSCLCCQSWGLRWDGRVMHAAFCVAPSKFLSLELLLWSTVRAKINQQVCACNILALPFA